MRERKNDLLERIVSSLSEIDVTSEDDLKAIEELESEVNTSDLETYMSLWRRQERQFEERQKSEEKKYTLPFRNTSFERLLGLSEHWHPSIRAGATEELATRELIRFTTLTYPGYIANWHHIEYARKLDAFLRGDIKKLMVFMPPQHGKSELCSRRMPAKLLGDNPDARIAIVSYNHVFSSKFNRDIQRIIDGDEYRKIYPDTFLNTQNIKTVAGAYLRNADEFEIVGHRGSLVSVGVGGGLTGRPVDYLIIDDPYKSQKEAWSPTVRRSIQDWYDTVALTRLHNNSQQLITLTRWHEDDLAGHILKTEGDEWDVVIFPALKEGPPLSYDPRKPGETLWPEVHSKERMEAVKKRNSFVFGAMYQQDPKPAEGLLFPPDSLHYYSYEDIKGVEFDSVIAVSDVADTGTDYYCMVVAGLREEKIYILDVVYTQEPVKITIPLTISMLNTWRPAKHRIESNNGGSIFAYTIEERKTTPTTIEAKFTSSNKETRILMGSGQVQDYCYFREDYSPDTPYADYMDALTGYLLAGSNAHDDAADATTMLVEFVHPASSGVEIAMLETGRQVDTGAPFLKKLFGRLTNSRPDKWNL